MSLHSRFHRAFDEMRARFRQSHPEVKAVTYEIPGGAGSTLRLQVGVVVAGWDEQAGGAARLDIEEIVHRCLEAEGLPAPTEILIAAHEELRGETAHRHFFAKAARV
jgi:hypothetical protein